ncbi:MAG TPA: hypothetical protein VFZ19_03090 [Solirubrobacterales bacterium]
MNDALKTATAIVGLLAAVVTGLYVLGGLVIALRLLFDHFAFSEVVTTIGQLPRAPVVATALVNVIGPALTLGLVMGLFHGVTGGLRLSEKYPKPGRSPRWWEALVALLPALIVTLPGLWVAHRHEGPAPVGRWIIAALLLAPILLAAWYLRPRIAASGWSRVGRSAAVGAAWAVIALIPMVLVSSALPFERAQVCVSGIAEPVTGKLIGESDDRILLEEQFGREVGVIALPADQVTLSEYGDLSSSFACPAPAEEGAPEEAKEPNLGGHGSAQEQELATRLRPRLRFDSEEPWRPISVNAFLAEEFSDGKRHQLCDKGSTGSCTPLKAPEELLREPGEAGYIDIHGEGKNGAGYETADEACIEGDRTKEGAVLDCNAGPGAAMYYRRTTHEGRWYWDYWWFFRYNDYKGIGDACDSVFCGDHEGDWEGITVVTTPTIPPEVVGAIYAAHAERVLVKGSQLPKAGNHPLVFVAKGTHASYPFWCTGSCRQYKTIGGERLPETHHDGAAAWGANSDAECGKDGCVRPLPEVGKPGQLALPLAGAWAGWPGRWGGTCYHGCKGVAHGEPSPRSPGTQTRFSCPWAATRVALPRADNSGLSRSERLGDAERLLANCAAQRGGI